MTRRTRVTWGFSARTRFWPAGAVLAVFGTALAGIAAAQADAVPEWISYQGAIDYAVDGEPVAGLQDITFRLYPGATGGQPVWGEIHRDVQMASGIFNVYLGSGEALDGVAHTPLGEVLKTSGLWLAIAIGEDDEIPQREPFLSVPYAMAAKHVTAAVHGVPPGTVVAYAGATVPAGWLLCNGATHQAAQYPALYGALTGTAWNGAGNPSFQVPNLSGRALMGADVNTLPGNPPLVPPRTIVSGRAVGTRLGQERYTLSLDEIPPHTHTYNDSSGGSIVSAEAGFSEGPRENRDDSRTTGSTGGGTGHNEVQPSASVLYIIKH